MIFKITLAVAVVFLAAVLIVNRKAGLAEIETADVQAAGAKLPVLVELFTSEGCSSCPRADELLGQLEQMQPINGVEIIALSEHVDYWNHLGWKDPYSSPLFSARQSEYARVFGVEDVYTPQMVVDGRDQFVGSNVSKARETITKASQAPKATVTLTRASDDDKDSIVLYVSVAAMPHIGYDADVLLAITEDSLESSVSKGENKGRNLRHTSVVRKLDALGKIGSNNDEPFGAQSKVRIDKYWKRENIKAVVFVQEHKTKQVRGVASLQIGT